MNPYLRPFLVTLLAAGCIGGDEDPTLDDEICFTVDLGDDCLEGQDARDAYEGRELCESPVRTVIAIGELVGTDVVAQTDYGYTQPADTADTGNIRTSCCYEAAMETDPNVSCTPGRPFTTDGVAHRSDAIPREDWRGPHMPCVDGLTHTRRAQLATAWLDDAVAEHASVPAFARLAVELSAHGAPPQLLARCAAAMSDEVRHAQACFALASAYADQAYGPGPVQAPPRNVPTLVDLAVETLREGCIGESLAAGRAAVQLGQATDPAVRRVLAMIVDDETRHAELAWDILRWAVEAGGDEVREAIAEAAEGMAVPAFPATPEVAAHGLPNGQQVRRVLQKMVADVVEPSLRDLLAA